MRTPAIHYARPVEAEGDSDAEGDDAGWLARLRTPRPRYAAGPWLFVRGLGLIHVIAFASFEAQLDGLIGSRGVFPAAEIVRYAEAQSYTFWDFPTLAWWGASDAELHMLTWGGMLAGVGVMLGRWPRVLLGVAFAFYLSLVSVGESFFAYQWDTLLLEATLVALPMAPLGLVRDGGTP